MSSDAMHAPPYETVTRYGPPAMRPLNSAWMLVGLVTVILLAAVLPTVTIAPSTKPVPVSLMMAAPAHTFVGSTAVRVGGGATTTRLVALGMEAQPTGCGLVTT